MIEVLLGPKKTMASMRLLKKLLQLDEVSLVMLMSGGYDLGVDVRGRQL